MTNDNKKPIVVVPGLIRKDAIDYLSETCEVRQWTEKTAMPKETLKEWLKDADGLWVVKNPINDEIIADAPNLKVIAQASVGYDNVDIKALTARKIPYGNTPVILNETVAELAFTLAACASRRILENFEFVRSGEWEKRPSNIKGVDMSKRTMGIIGMGSIGVSISRRARAFGMSVVYYNRTPRKDDAMYMTTYMPLDELLEVSDIVMCVLPLTPQTEGLLGKESFKKMKNTAIFVNVGRGKVVDSIALAEALEAGEIEYAALDVTDPEPLAADHPLLKTGKCLVTPHIASYTDRTRYEMAILTADNIIQGVKKKALLTCVNPEVNYEV